MESGERVINHAESRDAILREVQRELIGPSPVGKPLRLSNEPCFETPELAIGPWYDEESGEEILTRDSPTIRYGVGVLFPVREPIEEVVDSSDGSDTDTPDVEVPEPHEDAAPAEANTDDFELSLANAYRPSSLGVTFLVDCGEGGDINVTLTGGRYSRAHVRVMIDGQSVARTWWVRRPVRIEARIMASELQRGERCHSTPRVLEQQNCDDMGLSIEVVSRSHSGGHRLVTVYVVNRSKARTNETNEQALFQTRLAVRAQCSDGTGAILPYPRVAAPRELEEESLELLYRDHETYATGHGCSADWCAIPGERSVRDVTAECLPVVTTPNITSDIRREDGSFLAIPMASLAGLTPGADGFGALEEVINRYEAWIHTRNDEIKTVPQHLQAAASRHVAACTDAAARMRAGLRYLQTDTPARHAFQLANHAILLQQAAQRDNPRTISFNRTSSGLTFGVPYSRPDAMSLPEGRGSWRAFQIAFLLASIRSTAEHDDPDRETVELIWFPTGGGKTEAYLALAAFGIFKRRLASPSDAGVHVLMRYTLRLLTAQQFQRACGLICAMEVLRREREEILGATPFSAGIWLGSESTPNRRSDAVDRLHAMQRKDTADNPFLLTACPWCGADFQPVPTGKGTGKGSGKQKYLTPAFRLYRESSWPEQSVALLCPDQNCDFRERLPIFTVDEDIYVKMPTLVIGTIDKFAMLAWVPDAAALFGLNASSPPGLIIQDELHLIAGPLGSVAGLYEVVIEELCTRRQDGITRRPKIVCSTATIRAYSKQIRALYGRPRSALFPPPGITASDSFFARFDTDSPGRMYVGVHAPSLGSVQTEWVRTFTTLLHAPMVLPPEARDPWWTMLVFFNSIREMGTAHTLFQSDVPDRSTVLWNRVGALPGDRRRARIIDELTGGLRGAEVTAALAKLQHSYDANPARCQDVCLASSIIEVGIDVPRLALIVVAGQPKTTSQYIQVTGRVGRRSDRPGLVVVMYSPSKPRDRSHYERFRSYHERLYAHVEPTSVTPFSTPALDRALHAAIVAFVRQTDTQAARSPHPVPVARLTELKSRLLERVNVVDVAEEASLMEVLAKREAEWKRWQRTEWRSVGEEIGLIRPAGEYAAVEETLLSWPTPMSMRHVDAECQAQITQLYLTDEVSDAEPSS